LGGWRARLKYIALMLSDTLFRVPRAEGLHLLQRRGERGARELTTWRLRLSPGKTESYTAEGEETVLVLQQGSGTLAVESQRWEVARPSVFEARATALYIPPGKTLTVTANDTLEAVLVSTPAPDGGSAALTTPDAVTVNPRGRGNYTREVHDIFVRDEHAKRLMVGETFNPAGH
jgi:5-deoxy-glucuronate isomerase